MKAIASSPFSAVLQRVLQSYEAEGVAQADIEEALKAFPSLFPKEDTFVSNDGQSSLLVSLKGTVPITFRNNQYNIPIEVWLPKEYPQKPPLCFVRPTSTMAIREKHRHVDSAGQCYMPYLHQWQHQRQPGNLVSLLSQLQEIFSQDPPVYAKPQPQNVIMQQQPATAAVAVGHTFVQHTPIKEDEHQLLNNKLVAHAASLASQIEADNAKMLLIYERLSDGAQWLTHCKEQVLQTKKKLEEILLVTMQQDEKLSHWLSTQDHALQADKAFVPTDALSLQIYQAVAEDAAIEDVLYYYDKALHQGKISLDFFLKMTRSLCCEQFQKRAIAAKIFQHQQNNKS